MKRLKASFIAVIASFLFGLGIGNGWAGRRYRRSGDGSGHDSSDEYIRDNEDGDSPADLSKTGWKVVLLRTKQALKDKQLSSHAAGLAYSATLTFFPAMLGAATVFATFAGTSTLLSLLNGLKGVVPPAIYDLLHQQLGPLATAHHKSLGIAAIISVLALVWTTSGGFQNLVKATNVAYEVHESRGMIKLRLLSIAISVVLLILGGAIFVLLVLQGTALTKLGAPHLIATLFPILRWPVLVVLISIALSLIYRYAPDRKAPQWSWVSWGATAATMIWLVGTILFFFYAQKFGNFNKSYGVFAGIIILMTWFNLSALIVLIGAQVNKKLEEVTSADTRAAD